MNTENTGAIHIAPDEPALPHQRHDAQGSHIADIPGLTARQLAAMKLMVPSSGTPWLDDMIETAVVRDTAARIVGGFIASYGLGADSDHTIHADAANEMVEAAYVMARTVVHWEDR